MASQETDNEATRYIIDSIRAEFVNSGFKVIARSAEQQAEARGEFDYYLNILDISYDDGQSDIGSVKASVGGNVFENYVLKARIKLLDNNKDAAARQELANVSVLSTKRVPRDAQMPKRLAAASCCQCRRRSLRDRFTGTSMRSLLTMATPQAATASSTGNIKLAAQYSVKIMGLTQRDREQIRALPEERGGSKSSSRNRDCS